MPSSALRKMPRSWKYREGYPAPCKSTALPFLSAFRLSIFKVPIFPLCILQGPEGTSMIDHSYQFEITELDRIRCGPLVSHLASFAHWLSDQGYSRGAASRTLGYVVNWSRSLGQRRLTQLNGQRVRNFLKQRKPSYWHKHARYNPYPISSAASPLKDHS